ncbi:MAG: hypothetical protein Q8755_02940, partial [Candidatus Phytoplasma australasiaticum]|nr:hypothetical protein [Candidatus Phytoplasma australasiaticum]
MISLVYNKPFSFSQFLMYEIDRQSRAEGPSRFVQYPRFIMMILRHMLPNLPHDQPVVFVNAVDKRILADCRTNNVRRPVEERPVETAMFGAVINPAYQPPPNNGFADPVQQQPEGAAQPNPEVAVQPPPQPPPH